MITLARTPLYDWHQAHHGKLVDFAGWSMPVQYGSIVEEHQATRRDMGLFDVSHMGRLRFVGARAGQFLDGLLTRSALKVPVSRVRYSLVTNDNGGILDDVLVYHLADAAGRDWYELVVNAGNREKIVGWLERHGVGADDVGYSDQTLSTAMVAVQGPRAIERLESSGLFPVSLAALKYYAAAPTEFSGQPALVSRTGYTGEDGVEIVVAAAAATELWETLVRAGGRPVGLGARDTLRLEAAMPLYGHELTEQLDPFTADLAFAVELAGRSFVGSQALTERAKVVDHPCRVGLVTSGRRVPREGYAVSAGDEATGYVTSGTFSPTLDRPIAMAYVRRDHAAPGTVLSIDIRGSREPAQVVRLPFYQRNSVT